MIRKIRKVGMSKRTTNKLPSIKSILDYWDSRPETYKELSFCFDREEPTCFACHDGHDGKYDCQGSSGWTKSRLERAHIIPDSLGGSNEPSNFVLLCKSCHKQNPQFISRKLYMNWLKKFHANQRDACISYLRSNLSEDDIVTITDILSTKEGMESFVKWQSKYTTPHGFAGAKTKLEITNTVIWNYIAWKEDNFRGRKKTKRSRK